jgi:hypothetical protein
MVPSTRIERTTSPLPRECSTTELRGQFWIPTTAQNATYLRLKSSKIVRRFFCQLRVRSAPFRLRPKFSGAGEGNRTLVVSLEGFCSTIELHPRRFTLLLQKNGVSNLNQTHQPTQPHWRKRRFPNYTFFTSEVSFQKAQLANCGESVAR